MRVESSQVHASNSSRLPEPRQCHGDGSCIGVANQRHQRPRADPQAALAAGRGRLGGERHAAVAHLRPRAPRHGHQRHVARRAATAQQPADQDLLALVPDRRAVGLPRRQDLHAVADAHAALAIALLECLAVAAGLAAPQLARSHPFACKRAQPKARPQAERRHLGQSSHSPIELIASAQGRESRHPPPQRHDHLHETAVIIVIVIIVRLCLIVAILIDLPVIFSAILLQGQIPRIRIAI